MIFALSRLRETWHTNPTVTDNLPVLHMSSFYCFFVFFSLLVLLSFVCFSSVSYFYCVLCDNLSFTVSSVFSHQRSYVYCILCSLFPPFLTIVCLLSYLIFAVFWVISPRFIFTVLCDLFPCLIFTVSFTAGKLPH